MKTQMLSSANILKLFVFSMFCSVMLSAQPMSVEARDNIHTLFTEHDSIVRSVELTENGYISVTETDDAKLASVLKSHVRQMRTRLKSGKMVRRWDPAFPEMVMHYDDMKHKIERTDKGIKVTVTGTTPEAIKVAHNHAKIISAFAKNGWDEHDVRHPAVLTQDAAESEKREQALAPGGACCEKGCKESGPKEKAEACGKSCCMKGNK